MKRHRRIWAILTSALIVGIAALGLWLLIASLFSRKTGVVSRIRDIPFAPAFLADIPGHNQQVHYSSSRGLRGRAGVFATRATASEFDLFCDALGVKAVANTIPFESSIPQEAERAGLDKSAFDFSCGEYQQAGILQKGRIVTIWYCPESEKLIVQFSETDDAAQSR